jgi:hypothetical protein
MRRLGPTLVVAVAISLAWAAPAIASPACAGDFGTPEPEQTGERLRFGIFPGGAAGVIAGPRPPAVPEDQARIDAALAELRGDRAFVVHQYMEYSDPAAAEAGLQAAEETTTHYAAQGLGVEWVVRYRPAAAPDVERYAEFLREVVRRLGDEAAVKAIQVTNEVNNRASPDASDGSYAGATDALVAGVLAAKDEARWHGYGVEVGFNWFYRTDPASEEALWTELGAKGGSAFAEAVDWVGLDVYPGTFFPPATPRRRETIANALSYLRDCLMPLAALPEATPIHITENGWPTAPPARSYSEQETALREMVGAAHDFRANFNVTDYRWFDLRDSNSSDPRFEQQYGLMRDDYSPKPAFEAYRSLIAELGEPAAAATPVGDCRTPLLGSSERDVLRGTRREDGIRGRAGADRITGRGGRDCLSGGRGNDRISAADRVRDRIDCGGGRDDVARVDRRDRVRACEGVRKIRPAGSTGRS